MVLLKRKYVAPLPPPTNVRDDQEVWVVRQTGEIFAEYEAYLARWEYYKRPVFTCELTGRTNVNFFTAFASEVRESKGIDAAFPEQLKEPLLRLVQGCTITRMDSLIDTLYDHFKTEFYPGEWVTGNIRGERRDVLIREKSTFNQLKLEDGTTRPAFSRFRVEVAGGGEEFLEGHSLHRERNAFTKAILRSFIKNAVTREAWNGAPWIVRDRYAQRYRIDNSRLGDSLKRGPDKGKQLAGVIRFPIEDLELPIDHKKIRPKLNYERLIDRYLMGEVLETWTFLNVYCEAFVFDSFTFDDFVDAVHYSSPDTPCELFTEMHCALLKALIPSKDPLELEVALPQETSYQHKVNGNLSTGENTEENASVVSSLSDPNPNERVDELFQDLKDWKLMLHRREFSNGGWEAIIAGLLRDLSISAKYEDLANDVLAHLLPVDRQASAHLVRERYRTLERSLKFRVLSVLCQLTLETTTVRGYMEDCAESVTEIRKERMEAQRNRKALLELFHSSEEELKKYFPKGYQPPLTPASSPSLSPPPDSDVEENNGIDDTHSGANGVHHSDSEDPLSLLSTTRSKTGSTPQSMRKRKEAEAIELAKLDPAVRRIQNEMVALRAKIVECEEGLHQFEVDLREADCPRLRLLGLDRFFNRYWFVEMNGMPYGGMPDSSTAFAGYAMGRLWVQGPTDEERDTFLRDEGVPARRKWEEGSTILEELNDWGYYDRREEIVALLGWLNTKGVRECKLSSSLTAIEPVLSDGMDERKNYLAMENAALMVESRPSTRTTQVADISTHRCLAWRNQKAIDTLGHIHSERRRPGPKRGQARKKRKRKWY